MKKTFLFSCIFATLFFSCSEEPIPTNNDNIELRSLAPDGFKDNWELQTDITLTNGDIVKLPWIREATSSIPFEIASDIKKADGWIFLSTNNTDKGSDYLIFYNKFSGLLRIFYYYSGSNLNNNAIWTIKDLASNGYLNQGSYFTYPMDKIQQNQISVGPVSNIEIVGLEKGWNTFQVPITYTAKNGYLDAFVHVLNIENLELEGNYNEKTKGTIIEKHSTNPATSVVNTIAKATGSGVESWLKSKAEGSKTSSSGTETKEPGIFKNISNSILNNLASGGASYLVSGGLNVLFGSFLGIFNSNTPKIQTVELTTTGQLKAVGTITTPSVGIANPLNGINANSMGSWNLETSPKIRAQIDHEKVWTASGAKKAKAEYYRIYYYSPTYNVAINPEIKDLVTIQSKSAFVEFNGPKWDETFKTYYNNEYLQINPYRIDRGRMFVNNQYGGKWPEIYQNRNDKIAYTNNKTIGPMNYVYTYLFVYSHDYIINPYDYQTVTDINNILYENSTIDREEDIVLNPNDFNPGTTTINGRKIIYPGNIGVNITVTMTVKATGQKIVSSRTYFPEYEFKSK